MIRILIVDDHPIVCKGIRQIINDISDMRVVGEAQNGSDAIEVIMKNKEEFDVILLDISMPQQNGLEVLKQIRKNGCNTPVIVFSIHPANQFAFRAIKNGASAYITKDSDPEILIEAIRKVRAGKEFLMDSVVEQLVKEIQSDNTDLPHKYLSDREYQVFQLIGQGLTLKEISERLFLDSSTISTYRSRILEKMKMKNNAELIRYAINNHLV